jgi:hypothetical protein
MTLAPSAAPTRCGTARRAVGQAAANPSGAGRWMPSPRRRGGACAPRPYVCRRGLPFFGRIIPAAWELWQCGEATNEDGHLGADIVALLKRQLRAPRGVAAMTGDLATYGRPVRIQRVNALTIAAIAGGANRAEDLRGGTPAPVGGLCVHNDANLLLLLILSTGFSRYFRGVFLQSKTGGFTP